LPLWVGQKNCGPKKPQFPKEGRPEKLPLKKTPVSEGVTAAKIAVQKDRNFRKIERKIPLNFQGGQGRHGRARSPRIRLLVIRFSAQTQGGGRV